MNMNRLLFKNFIVQFLARDALCNCLSNSNWNECTTIHTNSPFFAAGVILFLILLGILVVVFVRNRDISENLSTGKTHISYSADIDREIDGEIESHEQGKEGTTIFRCLFAMLCADLALKKVGPIGKSLVVFFSVQTRGPRPPQPAG